MQHWFSRATRATLAVFVLASLSVAAYDWWYIWPAQKCEKVGQWWDPRDHECLTPIPVWRITGRLPTPPPKP